MVIEKLLCSLPNLYDPYEHILFGEQMQVLLVTTYAKSLRERTEQNIVKLYPLGLG